MSRSKKLKKTKSRRRSAQKPSLVKVEIASKAQMARRQAAQPSHCTCGVVMPCPCSVLWLSRAEKLENLRGAICAAMYNLRLDPNFWPTLDRLPSRPRVIAKAGKKPKSSRPISVKNELGLMMRTAAKKSKETNGDTALWSSRLEKLTSLPASEATPLIPHFGKSGIWEALDALPQSAIDPAKRILDGVDRS